MTDIDTLYIDGRWAPAQGTDSIPAMDSYDETPMGRYRTASAQDVDRAVRAARQAFAGWSGTPLARRVEAVRQIAAELRSLEQALTESISRSVGMPRKLAARIQVQAPIAAWDMYADLADEVPWTSRIGHSRIDLLPVGVVACITPWNYPLHQITGKVAPALLAGCTVVLKPSELAPASAYLLAQAVERAGLPAGVFNLVHGTGEQVGEALTSHPGVDMVSFTGSTRAGRRIASVAGAGIKRLALELGGKSAALVLPGADLAAAVKATLASCMLNAGQTCSATTRLLAPHAELAQVRALLAELLPGYRMGDPAEPATRLGPLVSRAQQQKVLRTIDEAIKAGARPLGGSNDGSRSAADQGSAMRPPAQGYFVPPTVLEVTPDMAIAREEVFGPVLSLIGYEDIEQGIALANDTPYGLAATVWGATPEAALAVASRLRAGQVDVNGAPFNPAAPFGGFGCSGLGRENGRHGIEGFLEPRAIQLPSGYWPQASQD
ncbi:aldehyde dehydrogenase family protein [Orrella sp. JC864]|uniref:aldehyde dehydrogenase family protein n=1 Tax=Orrella sp. JC864 TaxID=3120298 RepID=UPI0030092B10